MLSERQIEHLLETCEARLDRPLTTLRQRLLRDQNPDSVIWELVLLHTLLGRFPRVEPEVRSAMPDATVRGYWRHLCSFEAATVTSRDTARLNYASEFNSWLYREIVKLGMPINGAAINTEPQAGADESAAIPEKHRWGAMQKHRSWQDFTAQLRQEGRATWLCPEGCIAVRFEGRHNGYVSAMPLVPKPTTDITKHPVYREIRKKARQIDAWPRKLKARPIVLAICTPGSGREFWDRYDVDDYSVRRAIFSALLDHTRMHDLDRINVLRQRLKFGPSGTYVASKRLRVSGSERISAVLIIRIQQDHGFDVVTPKSSAKPKLYLNAHARNPLSEELVEQIEGLDFNAVEYGPGWESWHGTARESLRQRNARRSGPFELRISEGEVELRLPSMQILRILAGDATAQEVFGAYGDTPPNPITTFARELSQELTLESIEIVEGDRMTRSDQQIAFKFGKGRKPVVARARNVEQDRVDEQATPVGDS